MRGKDSTRREFLIAATTLGGATASHHLAHAHDHAHGQVPSDLVLRVKALESLLVEKGLINQTTLDALIDTFVHKVGPRNDARVVARAWLDPTYKERLLANGTAAIGEFGYFENDGSNGWPRWQPATGRCKQGRPVLFAELRS